MRPVLVVWEDASVVDQTTWVDVAGAPPVEPVIFSQLGWLLELTPEHVVLTSVTSGSIMGARDRIPRGMVKSITELATGAPVPLPRKKRKKNA